MKRCPKCENELEDSSFYVRKNGKLHCYCKKCNTVSKVEQNRKIKKLAVEFLGSKCFKCGHVGELPDFDFHHKDPSKKEFEISDSKNSSFEAIKIEVEKCMLLCAICHRRLHAGLWKVVL